MSDAKPRDITGALANWDKRRPPAPGQPPPSLPRSPRQPPAAPATRERRLPFSIFDALTCLLLFAAILAQLLALVALDVF